MTTLSYTEARDKLASVWDETAHLLRSPANARRLMRALRRLEHGQGTALTPDQLSARVKA